MEKYNDRPYWNKLILVLDMLVFNILFSPITNAATNSRDFGQFETLSDALGERIKAGKSGKFGKCICKCLHMLDKNHCEESIIVDSTK
jgi:hypothetical protein